MNLKFIKKEGKTVFLLTIAIGSKYAKCSIFELTLFDSELDNFDPYNFNFYKEDSVFCSREKILKNNISEVIQNFFDLLK